MILAATVCLTSSCSTAIWASEAAAAFSGDLTRDLLLSETTYAPMSSCGIDLLLASRFTLGSGSQHHIWLRLVRQQILNYYNQESINLLGF